MFFIYSFVTFSKTIILCPFSVKTFIENFIFCAKYFSEQICIALDKNSNLKFPLNTPIAMFGQMLERGFISTFVIAGLRNTVTMVEVVLYCYVQNFSFLLSFSYSVVYCICGSLLLKSLKDSIALFLLPNWAWESSTYRRNILGALPNVKANFTACFSSFYK